ncbi:hypothetical protein F5Y07DRAFT_410604 [Xylaria sp. FL0933]|nr:hypothetical protein F5Y07DRAFT_410604 [Xylaria sp. FL0933]
MAATKVPGAEVASSSTEEDKIDIILYPQGPSPIPKRQITLTPSSPIIAIGRSSQVPSKGFIPAQNNAWFENPVVSRAHAKIIAQFKEKPFSVYIKDIGSFHGTFHRGNNGRDEERRLTPDELVRLEQDDILRFGIEVFRNNKNYPPCSVMFKMEIVTPKTDDVPRRGFTVPDDIDDEDEYGDTDGESIDTAFYAKPPPNNTKLIKGAPSVNSSRLPLIDLTADDDSLPCIKLPISCTVNDCNMSSDIIDLTSEANCESDVEQCTVNPGEPRPRSPASRAAASTEPSSSLQSSLNVTQTSDEKSGVPPSCTVQSDEEWCLYHDSDLCDDDDVSDEDAESDICRRRQQTPVSDASLVSTADPDDISEAEHLTPDMTLPVFEEEYGLRLHDQAGHGRLFESSDEEDEEDEEDEDEDEDENEGEDEDEDEDEDEGADEDYDEDDSTDSSKDQPRIKTPAPLSPMFHRPNRCEIDKFLHSPVTSGLRRPVHPSTLDPNGPHDPPHDRDPSPSDAALFKRCPTLDSLPNDSRAQQLGEKTGKYEFFAAREANRAVINQNHSPAPLSAIRETLQVARPVDTNVVGTGKTDTSRSPSLSRSCAPEITVIAPEGRDKEVERQCIAHALAMSLGKDLADMPQFACEAPDATSIKLGDVDTNQFSAWTASGDKFINNPFSEESEQPQLLQFYAMDFDMTSAYKFQQSKLATAAQKDLKTRRVPIQDLLAHDPKPDSIVKQVIDDSETPAPELVRNVLTGSTSPPTKRSYEEAFNTTEVITHASAPCNVSSPLDSTAEDQSRVSCENIDTQATQNNVNATNITGVEGQVGSVAVPVQHEVSRPTKRMRLAAAAKVAACVALGGAATFSYLVNTAPVF